MLMASQGKLEKSQRKVRVFCVKNLADPCNELFNVNNESIFIIYVKDNVA